MLALARREKESIAFGVPGISEPFDVTIVSWSRTGVRLGIRAPKSVSIARVDADGQIVNPGRQEGPAAGAAHLALFLSPERRAFIEQKARDTETEVNTLLALWIDLEIDRRMLADSLRAENMQRDAAPAGHPSPLNAPRCVECGWPCPDERATCGRPECTAALTNKTTSAEEGAERTGQLPDRTPELLAAAGSAMASALPHDPEEYDALDPDLF